MKAAKKSITKNRITELEPVDGNGKNGKHAEQRVTVTPPQIGIAKFTIRGTAPYCQNKFSHKAQEMMRQQQEAGSTAKKGKKRDPKNFMECYENAMYKSDAGWCGIPATAIRTAMVDACRLCGFKMTIAKLAVFCEPDGFDKTSRKPLVKITKGEPRYSEDVMRNATGVCDLRARPLWDVGWEAVVSLAYDMDQFTVTDVSNLLLRAGLQVGIGEGRPNSKSCTGCGWGTFEIIDEG